MSGQKPKLFLPTIDMEPKTRWWLNQLTCREWETFDGRNERRNLGSMMRARDMAIEQGYDRYYYVEDDCCLDPDDDEKTFDILEKALDMCPRAGIVTMFNHALGYWNRENEYAARMYSNPAQFVLYRTLPEIDIQYDPVLTHARADTEITFQYASHGWYAIAVNRYINFHHLRPITRHPQIPEQHDYFDEKWGSKDHKLHIAHWRLLREAGQSVPELREEVQTFADWLDADQKYAY